MSQNATTMELISHYGEYVSADSLTVEATVDAPATTPLCVLSAIESAAASFATSQAVTATVDHGC
ncbi:hypothetical protein [Streptomyces sp. NPDC048565]|uniref:hypothetical protein n=1 Tax=Streptomyces sp. NPDC048565 TaxID=3155266 RepID=UPI0034443EDA